MVADVVSETRDFEVVQDAIGIIDGGLSTLQHREIVSAAEVTDLLLDLRSLLAGVSSPLSDIEDPLVPDIGASLPT